MSKMVIYDIVGCFIMPINPVMDFVVFNETICRFDIKIVQLIIRVFGIRKVFELVKGFYNTKLYDKI